MFFRIRKFNDKSFTSWFATNLMQHWWWRTTHCWLFNKQQAIRETENGKSNWRWYRGLGFRL
jgi:hypothetical protein